MLLLLALLATAEPRDPFASYADETVHCFDTPLQRTAVAAMKVQGVVAGTAAPRAMLAMPDGSVFVVRVGTPVGPNLGQVTRIRPGAVTVTEEFRDVTGNRVPQVTVLSTR